MGSTDRTWNLSVDEFHRKKDEDDAASAPDIFSSGADDLIDSAVPDGRNKV